METSWKHHGNIWETVSICPVKPPTALLDLTKEGGAGSIDQ
jgi:hypothetical protein